MRSTFVIVTPAADPSVLTIEQLRRAAGLQPDDDSRDAELEALGSRITADIMAACNIRGDGIHAPTLLRETVRESFRMTGCENLLFLSRRFVTSVLSVSDAGTALTIADDVDLDEEAGLISRISGSRDIAFRRGTATIEYVAGFDELPPGLVGAALELARLRLSEAAADPLERSVTITTDDVETVRRDRWIGAVPGSSRGAVPDHIAEKLSYFINVGVA